MTTLLRALTFARKLVTTLLRAPTFARKLASIIASIHENNIHLHPFFAGWNKMRDFASTPIVLESLRAKGARICHKIYMCSQISEQ